MKVELFGGPHDGLMVSCSGGDRYHLKAYEKDTFLGRLFGKSHFVEYRQRDQSKMWSDAYDQHGRVGGTFYMEGLGGVSSPMPFDYVGKVDGSSRYFKGTVSEWLKSMGEK